MRAGVREKHLHICWCASRKLSRTQVCLVMQARLEQAAQRVMADRASRAASQAAPRMPSLGMGMDIDAGSQSQSQVMQ
jgi:hypothetical protein